MLYMATPISAEEMQTYGQLAAVTQPEELLDVTYDIARNLAKKSPSILRRAKEAMNAIDPIDVKRSYRMEQGFTYELHVRGVADEQRQAFVEKRDADTSK
jgi:enoyl-CoA hydratase